MKSKIKRIGDLQRIVEVTNARITILEIRLAKALKVSDRLAKGYGKAGDNAWLQFILKGDRRN